MKKKLLVLLLIIIPFSIAMTPVKKEVVIDGDAIIGYQKDIERFQECEQFLIDWFASKGYNLSYDVNVEFVSDVGSKMSEEDRKGFKEKLDDKYKLAGIFYKGKIYIIDYYKFLQDSESKFDITAKSKMIQRGVIIHELVHYYLFKYGVSITNSLAVHEYMATIAEIDSYEQKYRSKVLKEAADLIAEKRYNAPEYIMYGSNYLEFPKESQILAYWVYRVLDKDQLLINSIMSTP